MKVDKKANSVYGCVYNILITSKFLKFDFSTIANIEKIVLTSKFKDGIFIRNLKIGDNYMLFETTIKTNISVNEHVSSIKNSIKENFIKNDILFESPLFSTAFCCATKEVEMDKDMYYRALKKSYRSKKGELL